MLITIRVTNRNLPKNMIKYLGRDHVKGIICVRRGGGEGVIAFIVRYTLPIIESIILRYIIQTW
mgnify:CR=1 FL=1